MLASNAGEFPEEGEVVMRTSQKFIFRTLLALAPLALGGCLNVDTTHPVQQPTSTTVVVPPTTTTTVMPPTSTTTSTTTTTVCPIGVPAPC
jgi:hypothetical protein